MFLDRLLDLLKDAAQDSRCEEMNTKDEGKKKKKKSDTYKELLVNLGET